MALGSISALLPTCYLRRMNQFPHLLKKKKSSNNSPLPTGLLNVNLRKFSAAPASSAVTTSGFRRREGEANPEGFEGHSRSRIRPQLAVCGWEEA